MTAYKGGFVFSFLVIDGSAELPEITPSDVQTEELDADYTSIGMIILGIIIVGTILYLRRSRRKYRGIKN